MKRVILGLPLAFGPLAIVFASCNSPTAVHGTDAAVDRARLASPIHLDAACAVTVDTPPLLASPHVPLGTPVEYDSNPPTSGPHYAIWAAFKEFLDPVDRRYYVHDLEHGAVVLLYNCQDAGGCPDVVQGLRDAMNALPTDPLCDPSGGVRVRVVITPDPLLDVPVAAAAWGWTYKADCLDLPSLTAFARDHYAQAPENECTNGQAQF